MADYSYLGSGKIYMRVKDSTDPLLFIGNTSALNIAITENTIRISDYTKPGGGTYNSVSRIESSTLNTSMREYSADNLARALYGSTSQAAGATATAEPHTAYIGSFIPTQYPAETITTVTDDEVAPVELILGTDYDVTPGGILILEGGSVADGDIVLITYDYNAVDVVQALTAGAEEWEVYFAGLNEAKSNDEVTVHFYRVKFGPTAGLDLIGEDYGTIDLTGEILPDTSITAAGVSQYFKVSIANAA